MALTVALVDAIRADLAAVPPKDASAREVTRLEAIARMRGEIVALRERGYTWEEVAEMVSGKGCRVTAATLRTELSRKVATSKAKARDRRASGTGTQDPGIDTKPTVGKKAVPSAKESPHPTRSFPAMKPGGFVVREDSEI